MSGLELRDIRKSYGSHQVIRGVDLDIKAGAFVVFVGPSGCGKSTLLRMIAGLEEISGGDLLIGGTRMNDVDASKRGIAMVFQSYALYPHLTVRENMGFALKYAGTPKAEIDKQVNDAAQVLGLGALMDRRPKDLSGGQRQRVAIGRAIVRHPQVFLFDEPLSNLDAELRVNMRIEIARLHKELGSTIIYVTHDQVEAMTLADQIVVLRDGVIEQTGSPLTLYDDPDNQFVAGFLGSPKMNFVAATVTAEGLQLAEFGGQVIPMPPISSAPAVGTNVTVGLRPELFKRGGPAAFEVTVEIVEHLGGETYAHARQGAGAVLTIATDDGRSLRTGDTVTVHFDPARALIFDTNGDRLR